MECWSLELRGLCWARKFVYILTAIIVLLSLSTAVFKNKSPASKMRLWQPSRQPNAKLEAALQRRSSVIEPGGLEGGGF